MPGAPAGRATRNNLPHGVRNAILLPIARKSFNRLNAVARFALRGAGMMGVDTRGMSDEAASMSAIQAIRDPGALSVGILPASPARRDQSRYRRLAG